MNSDIKKEEQVSVISQVKKKNTLVIILGILLFIFAGAYYVCTIDYEKRKLEIFNEQRLAQETLVSGTKETMLLWAKGLQEEAERISRSDLYRLFLEEVNSADESVSSQINKIGTQGSQNSNLNENEDFATFVEQVPFMRDALSDYMNYNSFTDARIIAKNGTTILSALSLPNPLTKEQEQVALDAIKNDIMTFSTVRPSASTLLIDVALPIPPLFENETSKPTGALLLTQSITNQIAQFATRQVRAESNLTQYILQQKNNAYENIKVQSPVPEKVETPIELKNNVLEFALRQSVNNDAQVYSYGMHVDNINFLVVSELPAHILQETFTTLAWTIYGLGALASIGVTLLFALLWWVMIGTEQRAAATKFKNLYDVIQQQKVLLDSINVSLQVGLMLVDKVGKALITNKTFADIVSRDEESMKDESLMSLFEGSVAGLFMENVTKVAETAKPLTFEIEIPKNQEELLYRVTLYPYFEDGQSTIAKGAVATFQDITIFRRNSEKNKKQQVNTIQAFVRAIEAIDPYLTGHSQMMSSVGALMCKKLNMSDEEVSTIETASTFSQVGKLFIDRDILTKQGKLTEDELALIRQLPEKAYEVLSGIGFSAPIALAVREMYEQIDGHGYPHGKKGDEIILQARILAITNTFCALISERAFRAGLPVAEAIKRLKEDVNKFDSNLVDVLADVIGTPEGVAAVLVKKDASKE